MKELITAKLGKEDIEFLNTKRMNKTDFIRQAIAAHKLNRWNYVHKGRLKKDAE